MVLFKRSVNLQVHFPFIVLRVGMSCNLLKLFLGGAFLSFCSVHRRVVSKIEACSVVRCRISAVCNQ